MIDDIFYRYGPIERAQTLKLKNQNEISRLFKKEDEIRKMYERQNEELRNMKDDEIWQ